MIVRVAPIELRETLRTISTLQLYDCYVQHTYCSLCILHKNTTYTVHVRSFALQYKNNTVSKNSD